jgi:hypothetical protein
LTIHANHSAEQINTSSESAFAEVPPDNDPQSTEPVSIDQIIGDGLVQENRDSTITDNVGINWESGD